jgi:hypothetical protein
VVDASGGDVTVSYANRFAVRDCLAEQRPWLQAFLLPWFFLREAPGKLRADLPLAAYTPAPRGVAAGLPREIAGLSLI